MSSSLVCGLLGSVCCDCDAMMRYNEWQATEVELAVFQVLKQWQSLCDCDMLQIVIEGVA